MPDITIEIYWSEHRQKWVAEVDYPNEHSKNVEVLYEGHDWSGAAAAVKDFLNRPSI